MKSINKGFKSITTFSHRWAAVLCQVVCSPPGGSMSLHWLAGTPPGNVAHDILLTDVDYVRGHNAMMAECGAFRVLWRLAVVVVGQVGWRCRYVRFGIPSRQAEADMPTTDERVNGQESPQRLFSLVHQTVGNMGISCFSDVWKLISKPYWTACRLFWKVGRQSFYNSRRGHISHVILKFVYECVWGELWYFSSTQNSQHEHLRVHELN